MTDQRAQIIGVLKANPNATQAARKIGGVSRTTVGKIAKAAGITLAPAESGKRLSAEQRAQIIGALKANPNASEVAKEIGGVSYVVVWKIAKAAGIELTRGKAVRDCISCQTMRGRVPAVAGAAKARSAALRFG